MSLHIEASTLEATQEGNTTTLGALIRRSSGHGQQDVLEILTETVRCRRGQKEKRAMWLT